MAAALDFEIDIGAGGERGYSVNVRSPDGAEATATMQLPAAEVDSLAARIPDAVLASSAMVRRSVTTEERPVRQLGSLLYEALLPAEVRGLLVAARQRAIREGTSLRMVLRVAPPELARLPWEFLFDPGDDDYLCISTPLIRYPQVSRPIQPLRVATPLRILGMVARPADQQELAVEEEKRRLRAALTPLEDAGRVELGWVAGQTARDLRNALRDGGPWHVLHFIGHGGFDSAVGEGTLALAGEHGGTFPLRASDLAGLVERHHSLRLVLLNACDTGRSSALDPFSSVAGALMRKGVPAVLAMQFSITDTAAIEFSRTFYESIAGQQPVDLSVTDARQAVRIAIPGTLEWGTPVLYLRFPDGYVFDLADAPAIHDIAAAPVHRTVTPDVGRELEPLYTDALAAYYTEDWDQAVAAFRAILARDRGYRDAATKFEHARRQQQLAARYAAAVTAGESGDWAEAVENLQVLLAAEPSYRDAETRLQYARRRRDIAELQEQAQQLHAAAKWAAVVAIGERLYALDPGAADPGGLFGSATDQLAAETQARDLDQHYRTALEHIDTGRWRQALAALDSIDQINPGYRETPRLLARVHREMPHTQAPSDQLDAPPTLSTPVRTPDTVEEIPLTDAAQHDPRKTSATEALQSHPWWRWLVAAVVLVVLYLVTPNWWLPVGIFVVLLVMVRFTGWRWRAASIGLPIALLIMGGFNAWLYLQSSYFVGVDQNNVVIFQGSPDGGWFGLGKPKVKERPNPPIPLADLPAVEQDSVRQTSFTVTDKILFARTTVNSLRGEMCAYKIANNGGRVVIVKGKGQPKCPGGQVGQIQPGTPKLAFNDLPKDDQNRVTKTIPVASRAEADIRLTELANAAKACKTYAADNPDCP